MNVKTVEKIVQASFFRYGWQLERIHRLRPMYVKPSLITPAFIGRVTGDRRGNYKIDGGFSVLHRGFEQSWWNESRNIPLPRLAFDPNALFLHISNVQDVSAASFLSDGSDAASAEHFCLTLTSFLDRFPQDIESLRHAFTTNTMAGIDFSKYIPGSSYDPSASRKFEQLKNYVFRN